MSELPEWPSVEMEIFGNGLPHKDRQINYQTKLASAWEARARLAVKNMRHSGDCVYVMFGHEALDDPIRYPCTCGLREAFEAIGPLPESEK